jgi:hypothetical protein
MVYSLPASQVKPTRSVARYYSGKFPSAKKYRSCAHKYILEVVQVEIKDIDFRQYSSASERQTTAPKTSLMYQCPGATTASPLV